VSEFFAKDRSSYTKIFNSGSLKGTAFSPYLTESRNGFTACRRTHAFEGYGLQPVCKCFGMNPALAAEGTALQVAEELMLLKGSGFSPYVNALE
jgi:hypothetical protein